MKTCPRCNRVYTDETYSFCLEDGTSLSVLHDPQATFKFPAPSDNLAPTVLTVPSNLAPTQQFRPEQPSQSDIIQRLLNHLKDDSHKFSLLGRFRYNNEYIWTNGHFFEIAKSLPAVLIDLFPPKEDSRARELVESLETQLTITYAIVRSIAPSNKEGLTDFPSNKQGLTDLISDKQICHVNNIYYQYLQMRYPRAVKMIGMSSSNPALFVLDNKLRAGVMGISM
jgi:hypothetical protein